MELRVTMCLSPVLVPRPVPAHVGCWKCSSPCPVGHVPVLPMLVHAFVCTLVLQTLGVPLLSLDSSGCHRHPAQGWGSSAPTCSHPQTRCRGSPRLSGVQTPAQICPGLWDMWDTFVFHVHLPARPSVLGLFFHSPFPAEAVCITSANKLLTSVCGRARIKPPLISPLNNRKPSLTAVKTQA